MAFFMLMASYFSFHEDITASHTDSKETVDAVWILYLMIGAFATENDESKRFLVQCFCGPKARPLQRLLHGCNGTVSSTALWQFGW